MINFSKRNDQDAEVFTSAMNDIMFFLMLFFIIISTLLNPSMINVTLPKTQSSQSIHKKEINLTVTKELNYFVNNTQVQYDGIEVLLKNELAKQADAIIVLRIDNGLSIQELVNVLSIGNKLKTKMTIATAKAKV
ncbi:MAG: biopolymer transporter ExbD [Bacteroidota bacterium]